MSGILSATRILFDSKPNPRLDRNIIDRLLVLLHIANFKVKYDQAFYEMRELLPIYRHHSTFSQVMVTLHPQKSLLILWEAYNNADVSTPWNRANFHLVICHAFLNFGIEFKVLQQAWFMEFLNICTVFMAPAVPHTQKWMKIKVNCIILIFSRYTCC